MNVNAQALRAATLFTSRDAGRPVLQSVSVSDGGSLVRATDSYLACAVGKNGESPEDLVKRVMSNYDDEVLIPAVDIAKAANIAPKPVAGRSDYWTVDNDSIRIPDVGTVSLGKVIGQFPSFSSIFPYNRPLAIDDIAFDSSRLVTFHKAAQALYGANTAKKGHLLPILTLHGADSALKPAAFSLTGNCPTMVMLLMPVKGATAWGSPTPATA